MHNAGNSWTAIAKLFPGRSDNTVKNHWYSAKRRLSRSKGGVKKQRKIISSGVGEKDMHEKLEILANVCSSLWHEKAH